MADEVAAAGARVVVLTPDRPAVAAAMVESKGFTTPLLPVDKALWQAWGLENPSKPKLPHPGTLLVAPDGTLVARWTHINYKVREDPGGVLARLSEHRGGAPIAREDPSAAPTPTVGEGAPDWDSAAELTAVRAGGAVELTLTVAPGFHVYGAKEPNARPLAVRVDGQPEVAVTIPEGERRTLGALGESWVLEGRITLTVPIAEGADSGELDLQLCTDGACSMPETRAWSIK